ncbi:MAG TPA: hypothetical protein VGH27_20720 [Streptosporangiaceae bacterium]|jgi:hypothetical protein
MRKTPLATAAVAFACGALTLVTACSSTPAPHASASPGRTTTAPSGGQASSPAVAATQLTVAQAKQAFDAFFPRYDALAKDHTASQVAALTIGAQAQVMAFNAAKDTGLTTPAQLTERFYVPQTASYPRWFVETGTTRSNGAAGGDLFVMVQSQPSGPWQAADTTTWTGAAPAQLSAISLDAQGYATAVAPADTSLATAPGELPAQYAQVIAGTAGTSFSLYGAGDPTSQWAATQQQIVKGAPADGWHVSFSYAVPPSSEYALAATGGGAVVFFAFSQGSSWVSASSAPKFSGGATAFDGRMPLVLAMDAGLTNPTFRVGTRFTSTYVYEPLALDPAHGGKITLMEHELDGGGFASAAMG